MRAVSLLCLVGMATAYPRWGPESGYNKYFMKSYRPMAYDYMSHPMASVEVAGPQVAVHTYSHHQGGKRKDYDYTGSNLWEKMVGEQFFKHPGSPGHTHPDTDDEEYDSLPYTVVENYGPYEHREYPEAKFACVKGEIDNAEDPMAGLENMNPLEVMSSKRWRKSPSSYMFKELFKYISGVNKEGQEVEMTRPVSTHHQVVDKKVGGDKEVQEMCFYIPAVHQAYPPEPLDSSPVYIQVRPTMRVFARRFGGYLMTSEQWSEQRELLEALLMGKPYHQTEYFTNGYNSPMTFFNRRNEVWIEDTEFAKSVHGDAVIDAGVESVDDEEPVAEPEHHAQEAEEKE